MDFLLDDNNDFIIEKNSLVAADNINEVKQKILAKLRTFQGEWFLDLGLGMPYYQEVLKKGVDLRILSSIFKSAILEVGGVTEITSFTMNLINATRELSIDVTFRVGSTTTTISEVV